MPNTVTKIGIRALSVCHNLTNVTFSKQLSIIESGAFFDCQRLDEVSLPNTVTDIGRGAFERCLSLKSITIPENVSTIEDDTFYECRSLNSVSLPANLKEIGFKAFAYCDALKEISIPKSVTYIGGFSLSGKIENAYFAETSGWTQGSDSLNRTAVEAAELADSSKAAKLLNYLKGYLERE